jgi:hypothetical protein
VLSVIGLCVGRSLVQRSRTKCGVSSKCDRGAPEGENITQNRVEAPQEKTLLFLSLCKDILNLMFMVPYILVMYMFD